LKSITIAYDSNPQMPKCILADSFRIQQILGNLLSNAIKFSPVNSSVDVSVDVNLLDSTLVISVRDYGEGIKAEDHKRIFDPFYQAAQGMKFGVGGSGLGLSICKQLAIQMGGGISLESKIGWGSLFVVTLAVEFPLGEMCDVKEVVSSHASFYGKVLVAEDNEANQELIRITLQQYGLEVKVVPNGHEAIECVRSGQYDLIFMDEQMPIMHGHEAVEQIRKYEIDHELAKTPIIALSANVLKGSREKAMEWGYDAFIGKPFSSNDIEVLLDKYLKKSDFTQHKPLNEENSSHEMKRLEKVLMLSPEQILQLLNLFHKNMAKSLGELKEVIEMNESEEIARISHAIKGSSANFRFEELSRLAALLEEQAVNNSDDFDFNEAYGVLVNEYEKLYSSR